MQDHNLEQAVNAIKSGNTQNGYRLLKQTIETKPRSADAVTAWLWMSIIFADNPSKKRKSIESALAINPNSLVARKELAKLLVGEADVSGECLLMCCPQCGLSFSKAQDLKRHVAKEHRNINFSFSTLSWVYANLKDNGSNYSRSSEPELETASTPGLTSYDILEQMVRGDEESSSQISNPIPQGKERGREPLISNEASLYSAKKEQDQYFNTSVYSNNQEININQVANTITNNRLRNIIAPLLIVGVILAASAAIFVFFGPEIEAMFQSLWLVLQELVAVAIYIFIFPVAFPLGMIVLGVLIGLFIPGMSWTIDLGVFLLSQPWWWFPVGWIVGAITGIGAIMGG